MSGADGFAPFDHVTEREVGPWYDCTFAAGLEVFRDGFPDGVAIPPTVEEKEALRAAAGMVDDHGGASIDDLIRGGRARYQLAAGYYVTGDWADVSTALRIPGFRLVVQGSMAKVPATLRRWDPGFTGGHAVAARGNTTAPMWCDPLAPKGTYAGEPVTLTTWQSYFTGLPGARAFITEVGALTRGGPMAFLFSFDRWKVKAGVPFYDQPNGAQIGKFGRDATVSSIGVPLDRSTDGSPGKDFSWRAVIVTTAAMDKVVAPKAVYVKRTALTGPLASSSEWDDFVVAAMRDPESYKWDDAVTPPPDSTPFSQADLDAAVAAESAEWEAWVATRPK